MLKHMTMSRKFNYNLDGDSEDENERNDLHAALDLDDGVEVSFYNQVKPKYDIL